MKTILVPLDYTAATEATLAYANKLAVRWPAEIVLPPRRVMFQANSIAGIAPAISNA